MDATASRPPDLRYSKLHFILKFAYGFWLTCASLVVSIIFSNHVNAADTVALVSDVSGKVVVKTNSGSSPVKLLGPVLFGDRIDLPAGAKLSMIYVVKGDEYKLSGPGSYQVEASSPKTISGNAPEKQVSIGGALSGKKIHSENVAQATMTMRGVKKGASSETTEQAAKLRPGKGAPISERVAYALWLESESLKAEAKLAWEELAAEFPDQPNLRDRTTFKTGEAPIK